MLSGIFFKEWCFYGGQIKYVMVEDRIGCRITLICKKVMTFSTGGM